MCLLKLENNDFLCKIYFILSIGSVSGSGASKQAYLKKILPSSLDVTKFSTKFSHTAPDRASPMQRRQRQRRYNSSNRCGGHRLRLSDGFYEKV